MTAKRRYAAGAELTADGADLRVWAPGRRRVEAVIGSQAYPLEREGDGYFRAVIPSGRAGTRYRFRLDDESDALPDPASRYQPEGPHGDSMIVDPAAFAWNDRDWRGPNIDDLVIYEMHVGTFTGEGTWRAAANQLAHLRDTGINMIEMMPVHEFPGRFGWGYDGVDLWAASHLYGRPDDLRAFVDSAHALGIAVILDVVYNHLGPDGCYLARFTRDYFTDRYECEWGDAVNFDGPHCEGVRTFFVENASYWIDEFHFDGLRLDATQSIFDASPEHVIKAITDRVRDAARGRATYVVAENEPQNVDLIERDGADAMWNDDWHHSAHVAATGRREAYYTDYQGAAQEFVSMARFGFLYQGQWYAWQKNRRGTPSGRLPPRRLVCYLENHDQLANSAHGERLHQSTSPGRDRALTALLLLGPNTPMLFQGQEFAASAPFLYFADHKPELAASVAKGRHEFLQQFRSIAATPGPLAQPHDPATFEACKLDHAERDTHREALALHRDLLKLRREHASLHPVEGAALNAEAFVLRFDDRLLIVNLGHELPLEIVPQPLLAPPRGRSWQLVWSSDAPEYGGPGTARVETPTGWDIPAEAAVLLGTSVRLPH